MTQEQQISHLPNRRFDFIDIAKGLGMLTIIWGHIASAGNAFVYAFHIPLFFFLSGVVFIPSKYPSFDVFLIKRIKGLLIPYLFYSFVTWLIWALYSYLTHSNVESYWMPLWQTFISQGSAGYLVHNVPLWFVLCLFSVEVLYFFISKLPEWGILLVSIILGVLGVLSTKASFYDFSTLPWSIDVAFMAIPFYMLGSLLTSHFSFSKQIGVIKKNTLLSLAISLSCFVFVVFGSSFNGVISMGHANLGRSPFLFYVTALFGVFGVYLLSIIISLTEIKPIDFVKWIGRNSFRVMAIHNPIKGVIVLLLARSIHTTTMQVSGNTLVCVLAFVMTLAVTSLLVRAIEKGFRMVIHR